MEEEVSPMRDGHHRPMQHRAREAEVGKALPEAEVAVLRRGREAARMLEGSSCLLDVGRVVLGKFAAASSCPGVVGFGMKRSRAYAGKAGGPNSTSRVHGISD